MEAGDIASSHNDGLDIDRQLMICSGDYKGGDLLMYNEDGSKCLKINLKDNPHFVDPRFNHEVTEVTEGVRTSLIIFRHYNSGTKEPFPIIDFVENNPNAVSKSFPIIKKEIEQAILSWLDKPFKSSPLTEGIIKMLRSSTHQPHQLDRPQLKAFVNYVKDIFQHEKDIMQYVQESK